MTCEHDCTHLLRENIRYALEPDNPALIPMWISRETQLSGDNDSTVSYRRHLHEAQFHLLLDTICDELLPWQWRCSCLDAIYLPLAALRKLSTDRESKQQVRRLLQELSTTCRYFQRSLLPTHYTP